jgi:hypothetical protein
MKNNAEILAEHYQKTYELTYELWKQRNQTFLILLAVIGATTLLTFGATQTNPLLVRWLAKVLDVTDEQDIQELGKSFPFGLLQSCFWSWSFILLGSESLSSGALWSCGTTDTLPHSSGKSEVTSDLPRNRSLLRGKAVFTGVIGHSFKAP